MIFVAQDLTPRTDQLRQTFAPFHGRLNVLYFRLIDIHPSNFFRSLAADHTGTAIDQSGNELPQIESKLTPLPPPSRPSILER